ncbi:hypothetical protein GCM10018791_21630 [Streptomyces zaomyceticus]|nr:hypothetical protein GCM10018791_21630 [Streptomyces zaomyceticus]
MQFRVPGRGRSRPGAKGRGGVRGGVRSDVRSGPVEGPGYRRATPRTHGEEGSRGPFSGTEKER